MKVNLHIGFALKEQSPKRKTTTTNFMLLPEEKFRSDWRKVSITDVTWTHKASPPWRWRDSPWRGCPQSGHLWRIRRQNTDWSFLGWRHWGGAFSWVIWPRASPKLRLMNVTSVYWALNWVGYLRCERECSYIIRFGAKIFQQLTQPWVIKAFFKSVLKSDFSRTKASEIEGITWQIRSLKIKVRQVWKIIGNSESYFGQGPWNM